MFNDFASLQFNRQEMKERLPSPIYKKWKTALYRETVMDRETADAMAHAMKKWALEKGASHYSHWFIPLTGNSAEKHHTFLIQDEEKPLLHFSGSSLIMGETDGSSFPTGGLRATFEARGFTYWDISSYAFIRDHVLYIPSIFLSYRGDQLDLKSPLIRAVDSFNINATRLLHLLGEDQVKGVKPMIGLEQEYFLVRKDHFEKRPDLFYTGRTLIGNPPPKGQEFNEHYLGSIPSGVSDFMKDVNEELWRLGIYAQCEHNESAPGQFEIVAHQEIASLAIDQNMILMDVLRKKALEHDMVCLLHEKPFKGINGSGKHNNISFLTSTGINLLEPGVSPKDNLRFLLFLSAIIIAVEKHSGLLRMSSSDAGNDERLGGFEAPPSILSVYLGEELHRLISQLLGEINRLDEEKQLPLPQLPSDNTDRNRTSPIAFTGNKFEFRMLGSSRSAAMLNVSLLAATSYELASFIEDLSKFDDPKAEVYGYIAKRLDKVKHILYEGDGYSKRWLEEAEKRGLPLLNNYVDSISYLLDQRTLEMFKSTGVLSEEELRARSSVLYSQYINSLAAESRTMELMIGKDLLPRLREELIKRRDLANLDQELEKEMVECLELYKRTRLHLAKLEDELLRARREGDTKKRALYYSQDIRSRMVKLRELAGEIETMLPRDDYPYPNYGLMLYSLD